MTIKRGSPWSWGATDAEIDDDYPCAALIPEPTARMIRSRRRRSPRCDRLPEAVSAHAGDLVMMRKQLPALAALAARST